MLHKDSNIDTDNVITTLKKGLKAIIVDGKRTFSTDDFSDVYKIRFTVKGNKTAAGWVLGNNLDKAQNEISTNTEVASQKQMSQIIQERYSHMRLYNKAIADWKKAKTEDRFTICEAFILVALLNNDLKIAITDIDDVSNYAKVLTNNVDKVLTNTNTKKFDKIDILEMLSITAKSLGWLK